MGSKGGGSKGGGSKGGGSKGGGSKGGGPEGWGFEGWGAKISRGLHTTTRELQTCTFERPGASNTTKIQREDTQRGKKRTNFAAGEGKKERHFGRSRKGRSWGRAVPRRAVPGRAVPRRAVPGRAVPGAPNMTKPKP